MPTVTSQKRLSRPISIQSNTVDFISGVDTIELVRTRTTVDQPNWRQKIIEKKNATTPLTASESSAIYEPGFVAFTESGAGKNFSDKGGFQFSSIYPTMSTQSMNVAVAKASTKYYSKLDEIRASLQGQQFIGEFHQVVTLLKNPYRELGAILMDMLKLAAKNQKKGRLLARIKPKGVDYDGRYDLSKSDVYRLMADGGAMWLQFRFGILPLVSDISGLMSILRKKAQEQDVRSYRCYGSEERSRSSVYTNGGDVYGVNYFGSRIEVCRTEHIIRFGYLHKLLDDYAAKVADFENSFLDPAKLPSTFWEITPWSWLIDYFVNVGDIINAVCTSSSNVVYVSKSSVTTRTVDVRITEARPIAVRYVIDKFVPWHYSFTTRSVSRVAGPVGIPPLVFRLPSSPIKLLNVTAILSGLLKGR